VKPSSALWAGLTVAAAGLGAVVGFVRTGSAQAPDPELVSCEADYATVGIAEGERARLHATALGTSDTVNVHFQFFDTAGNLLKDEVLALAPKTDVASELTGPASKKGGRLEFRATVIVTPASGDPGFPADQGCPDVLTSMELISGIRTFVVVAPSCPIGRHCPSKCPSPSPTPTPPVTDLSPDFATDSVTPPPPDLSFNPDLAHPPPVDGVSFPFDLSAPPTPPPFPSDLVSTPPPFPSDLVSTPPPFN
jgi:hypothetical protein